jgi:hypothetical protein
MTTKLTLTMEAEVIKIAKVYAKKKGQSLSDLIENYLKSISAKEVKENNFSPAIKKLMGSIKLPDNFDDKKIVKEAIIKKHLL